jgi:hypothetical protein
MDDNFENGMTSLEDLIGDPPISEEPPEETDEEREAREEQERIEAEIEAQRLELAKSQVVSAKSLIQQDDGTGGRDKAIMRRFNQLEPEAQAEAKEWWASVLKERRHTEQYMPRSVVPAPTSLPAPKKRSRKK